jgi:hypothetical protein
VTSKEAAKPPGLLEILLVALAIVCFSERNSARWGVSILKDHSTLSTGNVGASLFCSYDNRTDWYLQNSEWCSQLTLLKAYFSGTALGCRRGGTWIMLPVSCLSLKNGSSRARCAITAAKCPPADRPAMMNPFFRSAQNIPADSAAWYDSSNFTTKSDLG